MPRATEQLPELLLVDEVATHRVLEVFLPVDLDGAPDVAPVVGSGVLVDLDQDDAVVVEMALDPVGVDQVPRRDSCDVPPECELLARGENIQVISEESGALLGLGEPLAGAAEAVSRRRCAVEGLPTQGSRGVAVVHCATPSQVCRLHDSRVREPSSLNQASRHARCPLYSRRRRYPPANGGSTSSTSPSGDRDAAGLACPAERRPGATSRPTGPCRTAGVVDMAGAEPHRARRRPCAPRPTPRPRRPPPWPPPQ